MSEKFNNNNVVDIRYAVSKDWLINQGISEDIIDSIWEDKIVSAFYTVASLTDMCTVCDDDEFVDEDKMKLFFDNDDNIRAIINNTGYEGLEADISCGLPFDLNNEFLTKDINANIWFYDEDIES